MKKNYFRWVHNIFAICIITLLASCAKDGSSDLSLNEPESNPEFSNTITIDDAQAHLEVILSEMEEVATRSGDVAKPRTIASRYSTGSPITTRSGDDFEPYVHVFNFEDSEGFAIMSGDDRMIELTLFWHLLLMES